jgi:hypothetical protein
MRINLGISILGEDPKAPNYYHHIHREDVVNRIKQHPSIDPWTKDFLLKRINQYPDNALAHFIQNINQIVITAIDERSRIKKEEDNARKETSTDEIGSSEIDSSASGVSVTQD